MSWNYRAVVTRTNGETSYAIHEVYYDEQGKENGLTECGIAPIGDSLDDLKLCLELMLNAINKPLLSWDSETNNLTIEG